MKSFLASYWWALTFGVVLVVWIRYLVRRGRQLNEESTPGSTALTRKQHTLLIVFFVVMTAAIVILTYYGANINADTRATRCRNRYAAARSATDSAVVDSLHPQRDSRITCGQLRNDGKLGRP